LTASAVYKAPVPRKRLKRKSAGLERKARFLRSKNAPKSKCSSPGVSPVIRLSC
jgi:hypothetical protein